MMKIDFKPLAISITFSAVALGCADDEVPGEPVPPCLDKKQCNNGGAADEVGDGDGDEPEDEDEQFCTVHVGNGERTVYQCNGHLTATLKFETLLGNCAETLGNEAACGESHTFGIGEDAYEMPAVMACCDASGTPEDELLRFCAMDMVEQVCRSIPLRIDALIKQGGAKGFEAQAKSLLLWLNNHQQQCYDALHKPSDSPGLIEPASWKVNGGNNKDWPLLKNFTISLDKAVVESASLPDEEMDQLACEDTTINNSEVFEESGMIIPARDIDVYHLGDSFGVQIMGPKLPDGGRLHGSAQAVSQSICAEPWCSTLTVGEDDGRLVIEDLSIFADGVASISMGDMPLAVDRLALRLYGVTQAQRYYGNGSDEYMIEAGAAHFLVTGAVGDMSGTRWVSNTTPIRVQASDGGWTIESFTVEHIDGLGGAWQVAIPQTTWN